MRISNWLKGFLFVGALCLTGLPATAQDASQQQSGDPVADAARKARQKKKEEPKPKKVYTDDDFKTGTPEAAPANPSGSGASGATSTQQAGGSGAAPKQQAASGASGTKEDPNSEAAWRKRFKEQHDKIDRAEKELDVLSRELQKAQMEYYPDPQKAMTEQNTRADINTKTAAIEAKKKEIASLKQGLDDLEDQLRKVGGNPGWAR